MQHLPESDWKRFKVLRKKALERFCERVLSDLTEIARDESRTFHERYGDVYELVEKRDKEMARAFDDLRRPQAVFLLASMYQYGMLEAGELDEFSAETRERVESFPK